MNVHKHARLTPAGRAHLVARIRAGETVSVVAASLGVSRRTAYKWLSRFRLEGDEGLLDRSSRPRRVRRSLRRGQVRRIERLRRQGWSSVRIAREVRVPLSTVTRTLRRLGLQRLSALEPPRPVVRYERGMPGELLHFDTKKLGRIARVGHRIHGDRSTRVRGVGWEYLHVCIDDCSRVAYTEILPDEKGVTVTEFLRRAVTWFQTRGVSIQRVMTDNGSGYVSRLFRSAMAELEIRHLRTRPYTPRTNGKAERFIQTALREWAYAKPYRTSADRGRALPLFIRFYNQARPHSGIGGRTPQQRLVSRVNNLMTCDS